MAGSALLGSLVMEIGLPAAKALIAKLGAVKGADGKLEKTERLIATGRSAVDACKEVFGDRFLEALNERRSKRPVWTFEGGQKDYVPVAVRSTKKVARIRALRDEITLNLQRVSEMSFDDDHQLHSYFLGLMRAWMRRYDELLVSNLESKRAFAAMESLLDGSKRTFADVLKVLQHGGLSTAAALMIIYAVMVATGTGLGVAAAIGTFLFGVPVAQVAALVVGGALLAALSRVKFTGTNAMSACIAIAYRLLDEQEKGATEFNDDTARIVA
jgi:hypothetical protein